MIKQVFLSVAIAGCVFLAGCTLIDSAIPINPETGFREATELTKDITGAVPYGGAGLAALLFISNTILFIRKKKTDTGLMATIKAIEAASKDPEMKEMIAKLKTQLAAAHRDVNVQPLINRLLSKIKFS